MHAPLAHTPHLHYTSTACGYNCNNCTDAQTCTACKANYLYFDGKGGCVTACVGATYPDGDTCKRMRLQ